MRAHRAQVAIPDFVRIKTGALERIGIYAARHAHRKVALMVSAGLPESLYGPVQQGLTEKGATHIEHIDVHEPSFEAAADLVARFPPHHQAVIGLGGGRALDVAKYVAFMTGRPYYAVPTSLSNDGFCAPQASMAMRGRRRSLPAALPFAVIVDTRACLGAPLSLWWSGVGDLAAKITAIRDWKLAYHEKGEPVDDLAALLSTATVFQFLARPSRDTEGMRVMGTALMLNGIAMAMCGSSRPASGSEHLISHALDQIASRPRLHGVQVGMAAYIVSRLQGQGSDLIADAFARTGFWDGIREDPFSRTEWLEAVRRAPAVKPDRYTVLSTRPCVQEVESLIDEDRNLQGCFAG